ncbi:DUF2179 domain-containing protein [Clostridium fallax]|uniref:UPF0316 protein SAMN05443638_11115 n=1 Tax=Clostridium fallax TaxID=1533 RepID=A0A1M4W9C1_9CLOT|nr:DUF5698 domain-containing protein [Clostridium fallax]SHE77683.1 Uncharacterized protein YebE, UPF0316 family [Clostridium fallax]SQB05949.1 Uncharacterized protein conserved in bacteria (DUF2179) [Clostridium fallax]
MLMYIVIFISKIIEVSLTTIRTVMITRGEKLIASVIGFFEVVIWLLIVGDVLEGIQDDPWKMLAYALGFACGNYIGSIIEEKLAIGLLTINVIVSEKDGKAMMNLLRNAGLGVTILDASGLKENKKVLIIHAKRKRKDEIISLIENSNIKAVISVTDTKTVYGGYGLKK